MHMSASAHFWSHIIIYNQHMLAAHVSLVNVFVQVYYITLTSDCNAVVLYDFSSYLGKILFKIRGTYITLLPTTSDCNALVIIYNFRFLFVPTRILFRIRCSAILVIKCISRRLLPIYIILPMYLNYNIMLSTCIQSHIQIVSPYKVNYKQIFFFQYYKL